jgi:hypothetical protein
VQVVVEKFVDQQHQQADTRGHLDEAVPGPGLATIDARPLEQVETQQQDDQEGGRDAAIKDPFEVIVVGAVDELRLQLAEGRLQAARRVLPGRRAKP